MAFEKVKRAKSKLRLAITGVSGAGKTLGALMIANGMVNGDWDKVALIDTEHERARVFANRSEFNIGEFLYSPLYPPYTPQKYIDLIKEAAELVGSDGIVIIDSLSHAWNGIGGVLELKDEIATRRGQNGYTAWGEAGKIQTNFINTILAVDCHTIVTMRSKMEYALEENEQGKKQPVKIGLAPVQREDVEYEFDIVLNVNRNHIATTSKDVTFLDKYSEVITSKLGEQLKAFLDEGIDPTTLIAKMPITAEIWREIKAFANGNKEIVNDMLQEFGAVNASDLKQGQLNEIYAYIEKRRGVGNE